MSSRFLLVTTKKDLVRRLRDLPALLIWLGLPLAIGGMIGLVATGGGGVPRAKILLVDQDDSLLSGLIAGASGQAGLGGALEIVPVELEEGRDRMDAGEASALVVLPAGFQDAVLLERPIRLTVITNPAQRILPAMVVEGLEMLVEAAFYLQRILGEPLRDLAAGPADGTNFFTNDAVAEMSRQVNERAQSLDGVLFPPVLTVRLESDEPEAQPELNFGKIFLPGIIFMSILFIASGVAGDLWDERQAGTLRRFVTSPRSIIELLAGKILTAGALTAGAAFVGLAIGALVFDLPWWRVPGALLWSTLVGMSLFSLFLLLQTLAGSQRTAGLVSSLLVFPLIMIGGSFFPFEAMPAWMTAIGRWTPNGAGVTVLRQIVDGAVDPRQFAAGFAAIAVAGIVSFLLCVRRVAGSFGRAS